MSVLLQLKIKNRTNLNDSSSSFASNHTIMKNKVRKIKLSQQQTENILGYKNQNTQNIKRSVNLTNISKSIRMLNKNKRQRQCYKALILKKKEYQRNINRTVELIDNSKAVNAGLLINCPSIVLNNPKRLIAQRSFSHRTKFEYFHNNFRMIDGHKSNCSVFSQNKNLVNYSTKRTSKQFIQDMIQINNKVPDPKKFKFSNTVIADSSKIILKNFKKMRSPNEYIQNNSGFTFYMKHFN